MDNLKMNQEKSIKKLMKHTKGITLIFSDAKITYKCFAENKNAINIVVKSDDKENKKLQKWFLLIVLMTNDKKVLSFFKFLEA